jgi:hypothetical protein
MAFAAHAKLWLMDKSFAGALLWSFKQMAKMFKQLKA